MKFTAPFKHWHTCAGFPNAVITIEETRSGWGWFVSLNGEPTPRSELSDELRQYVQDYMMSNFPKMIGGE